MGLANTIRFISTHPLNRGARIRAIGRFVWWQVRSRLADEIEVPFVNSSRLVVSGGQTGATGNIYTGLHEIEEMGFALHLLRPSDLFVDVGANVGSYTILAAAAVGCRCISFEPDVSTASALERNVKANGVSDRVDIRRIAVGADEGEVAFTSGYDTLNHVATPGEDSRVTTVEVATLDSELAGKSPALLKVDVEGFEGEVLRGASETLALPELAAVIIETNGSGRRYRGSDEGLHDVLSAAGFTPCSYDPLSRELEELPTPRFGANTIYVRDPAYARTKLRSAPVFDVAGRRKI